MAKWAKHCRMEQKEEIEKTEEIGATTRFNILSFKPSLIHSLEKGEIGEIGEMVKWGKPSEDSRKKRKSRKWSKLEVGAAFNILSLTPSLLHSFDQICIFYTIN